MSHDLFQPIRIAALDQMQREIKVMPEVLKPHTPRSVELENVQPLIK